MKGYGKGNWCVVYQYNGKVYTREEALEEFYNKSYYEFLKNNSQLANQSLYKDGMTEKMHSQTDFVRLINVLIIIQDSNAPLMLVLLDLINNSQKEDTQ